MGIFDGKWMIVEMEQWDKDYIDLVEPGYFEFGQDDLGSFVFGVVSGCIDYRLTNDKGKEKLEFSWEGTSEYDPVSGRGWFEIKCEDKIYGRIFIHNSDDSWIEAIRN